VMVSFQKGWYPFDVWRTFWPGDIGNMWVHAPDSYQ
jgi:hypothetical protein